MSGREWVPAEWLDETVPRAGTHPDLFLAQIDGRWQLQTLDESDRRSWKAIALTEGQTVAFSFWDGFGSIMVDVDDDGEFHVSGTSYPAHANGFTDADGEDVYACVEDYVASGDAGERLSSGWYNLDVYYWSEKVAFRFEVIEGKGRLVPVDGLPLDAEERR